MLPCLSWILSIFALLENQFYYLIGLLNGNVDGMIIKVSVRLVKDRYFWLCVRCLGLNPIVPSSAPNSL